MSDKYKIMMKVTQGNVDDIVTIIHSECADILQVEPCDETYKYQSPILIRYMRDIKQPFWQYIHENEYIKINELGELDVILNPTNQKHTGGIWNFLKP